MLFGNSWYIATFHAGKKCLWIMFLLNQNLVKKVFYVFQILVYSLAQLYCNACIVQRKPWFVDLTMTKRAFKKNCEALGTVRSVFNNQGHCLLGWHVSPWNINLGALYGHNLSSGTWPSPLRFLSWLMKYFHRCISPNCHRKDDHGLGEDGAARRKCRPVEGQLFILATGGVGLVEPA